MRRDPLGREYLEMEGGRSKYDRRRLDELKDTLKQKYGTDPQILFWDWGQIERDRAAGRAPLADWVVPEHGAIDFRWSGAGMPFEVIHEDGSKTSSPGLRKGGKGPRLITFEIRVDRINQRDLEGLAGWMKTRIREVLKAVSKASRHEGVELPELAFLHHVRREGFERDLRRYDLHMQGGLTFRQIALLEHAEASGRPVPMHQLPRTIGLCIREETSVRASVKRIYRAIYREEWKARRRRLDAPALGIAPYACSIHPKSDCDHTCPTLKAWFRKVRRVLPSERTGVSRLEYEARTLRIPTRGRKIGRRIALDNPPTD